MERPKKIRIKYKRQDLVAHNGAGIHEVSPDAARQMDKDGWIILLDPLPPQEAKEKKIKEDPLQTLEGISWICSTFVDYSLRKSAESLGFRIDTFSPGSFSPSLLMKTSLIIIESSLRGFSDNQITQIKGLLFLRKIPFIYRIIDDKRGDFFEQCVFNSKMITFVDQKLMDYYLDEDNEDSPYAKVIDEKWLLEDKTDYNSFWREIDKVLKTCPQR
jgi:hypothetical protein